MAIENNRNNKLTGGNGNDILRTYSFNDDTDNFDFAILSVSETDSRSTVGIAAVAVGNVQRLTETSG